MSQQANIEWRDGKVPVSTRFDDPYFSLENGLAETEYVFLDGNGLPGRFRDGFHVAELGFGTGLNLLATLALWRRSGQAGVLHYTSFEAFPMAARDMIAAQAAFPELAGLSAELAPLWPVPEFFKNSGPNSVTEFAPGQGRTNPIPTAQPGEPARTPENARFSEPFSATENGPADLHFTLIVGDARATLPRWQGQADAWFLDGFSPARNPELWQPGLMAEVARHTAPGGTAATYTAAGFVRRGLGEAGFEVSRHTGFGRKRHMTRARMPARETAR